MPARIRLGFAALLPLLALLSALPVAAREVHVVELRHRLAEELAPLVETALGANGRAIADARTNSLVITGEPAAVAEALSLLASLDARLRTVLLRYEAQDAGSLAARGIRVSWQVAAGDLRVGNAVGAADGGVPASLRVGETRHRREGAEVAELRILEGESGRIATGVTAPLRERSISHGARGPVHRESHRLLTAESGVEVRPRILGDGRVDLALRPFHDRLRPDGTIERAGAETRVVISPGETIVLGRLTSDERSGRRELATGAAVADESNERLLLVTVSLD